MTTASETLAQQCIATWAGQPGGFGKHAEAHGATDRDRVDGITFYYFSDGSCVATKGRGEHHQVWVSA